MSKGERPASRYHTEIDVRVPSVYTLVLDLVGVRQRVLELGCAGGHLSKILVERGCHVVGVEVDPAAAKQAAEHCDDVIVGDLEALDFDLELGDRRFDVMLATDVLEHLREPEAVLAALRKFLAPGGYLVVSVPNVAHASVRLALLGGSFEYTELGLLDRTHLRFYTRESLLEMLRGGEFTPVYVDAFEVGVADTEVSFGDDERTAELARALERQPDAVAYQYVVVAYPSSPPLAALPTLLGRLSSDREAWRADIDELAAARQELEGLRPEVVAAREELTVLAGAYTALQEEMAQRTAAFEEFRDGSREEADRQRAELARLGELLAEQRRLIDELTAQRDSRQAALDDIHRSRLWKVATGYRRLVDALRRR